MQKILLLLLISFCPVWLKAQTLDVNNLLKLRQLDKDEISEYLLASDSNWEIYKYDDDKGVYSWANINKRLSFVLYTMEKDFDLGKEYYGVQVMTEDKAKFDNCKNWIIQNKMTRVSLKSTNSKLEAIYKGNKFTIQTVTMYNTEGLTFECKKCNIYMYHIWKNPPSNNGSN